jgi:sporulation protein YunB
MATVRVDYLATKAINEAITETIERDGVSYDSIVIFEKDIYGQITALKTNMLTVNRFKANVTNEVLDAVESIGAPDLGIPVGNVINGDLFSGRGPEIPIRILPLGTASADFQNVFTAAGINQTRHEIMMEVTVNISVLMPGYSAETAVKVQVAVAETVIVGDVPETYANFEDGGQLFSEIESNPDIVPE